MSIDYTKAPFPWFGGKRHAAAHVWAALGDPVHYVEAFGGSLAVLLLRPHQSNRSYHSETTSDADGLLCNAWRAIQLEPDATAEAASWPVSEADLHARHAWLLRFRAEHELERLMGDPAWCDARAAGYWLWGQSCWIGAGWCSGRGPWIVDADGRLVRKPGHGGAGQKAQLPYLSDDGRGVNHPQLREPGVKRQLPHLSCGGRGVNRPQLREPGVTRKRPHLNGGRGVNRPQLREPGTGDEPNLHPMTMPELRAWFRWLSARLRHVRILCGDWRRLSTTGATKTIDVRSGEGVCGVFLDPPYSAAAGRDNELYTEESATVAADVRAWCLEHGDDPDYRIVLAGFEGDGSEEVEQHGWTVQEWYRSGYLRGGMGNLGGSGANQQARERLWLSPHCLRTSPEPERQIALDFAAPL